jgi:ubiquitin-protein ligase
MDSSLPLPLPPQAAKRLLKDLRQVHSEQIKQMGIWYLHEESNMMKGTAMIRGPPGTPYSDCLLFFNFDIPFDYPFSPPKVTFLTGDGYTRLHPNLYVQGKVCLSILGTYPGPSWSANMTLETVLLNLQSLLDENPLANEPAYIHGKLTDTRHKSYADAVEHQMTAYMVHLFKMIDQKKEGYWTPFEEIIQSLRNDVLDKLEEKCGNREETLWENLIYGMRVKSAWSQLKERFHQFSRT